jgi:hypothetical protein
MSDRGHLHLFLDAGVIIQGCSVKWGAAKAVLILATMRDRYTVVLAEAVAREIGREEARRRSTQPPEQADDFADALNGWFVRVRLERLQPVEDAAVAAITPVVMPALRHLNDLPAVVAAVEARPDWVISTNRAHWNDDLAARSGLRIATPQGFLLALRPAT